ncbi:hypothetical protein H4K35_09995 [Myroides sp. NP-2]|uniref:hypothetical protein n=1 Tax=Myroides sp. NP-2 TaxID=2759945 RepID=UPI0015FCD2DC|nr:hypothetical protein [Myroides sp. NP-2]MBB1150444.1 hypothetical protein [Myroides sp. NP-2]
MMRNFSLAFLVLVLGLTSSCSKDQHYLGDKSTSIHYIGPQISEQATNESTQFMFVVQSKVNYNISVFVQAETRENTTLTSDKWLILPGESKEIPITTPGIIYDKDYIKSYRAKAVFSDFSNYPIQVSPDPTPKYIRQ